MVCIFTIYLLPAFAVLISRETVRQSRWRRLATEDAGVWQVTGTCGVVPKKSLAVAELEFYTCGGQGGGQEVAMATSGGP